MGWCWFLMCGVALQGAMALGHPLGGTGAKLMTTLLHELERRGGWVCRLPHVVCPRGHWWTECPFRSCASL